MMKGCYIGFLLLVLTNTCWAHRLNEYLQAATISLSKDNVRLELRLTPGVAVAPLILKNIDLNSDGFISEPEKQHYLNLVIDDLQVTLDDHKASLALVTATFPTIADFKKGIGDLIFTYGTRLDTASATHRLLLRNRHYPAYGVYLVNCLLPVDTIIHVTGQKRNADQSFYQLDFTRGPAMSSVNIDPSARWPATKTYLVHGIKHILTGYDHLLFLCALVLGASGLWDLVKLVTVFTIAHSITLTLAVFGLAHLPEIIVEPVIAVSIIFVAVQNIIQPDRAGSNYRLMVVFLFGLFHGLGFAGGLLQLMHAMPPALIVCAIIGFSIGVEAGNQLVLVPLYGGMRLLSKTGKLSLVKRYASALVAIAGVYYLITDLTIKL